MSYGPKIRLLPFAPIKGERGWATRRYVVGRIQLRFGVYNRVVHFGLSREHQARKAPVRAFFSKALAGELVL
jgi:hypothetical protein